MKIPLGGMRRVEIRVQWWPKSYHVSGGMAEHHWVERSWEPLSLRYSGRISKSESRQSAKQASNTVKAEGSG